jgi:hypothetical protein
MNKLRYPIRFWVADAIMCGFIVVFVFIVVTNISIYLYDIH